MHAVNFITLRCDLNNMRLYLFIFFISFLSFSAAAQELFPICEPASTMPKGVLGFRAFSESYKEPGNKFRNLSGVKIMYGLTPKLTIMAIPNGSNHHNATLPPDFPTHNTPQIGVPHPFLFLFNGVDFYAKYRFLSNDGQNTHFRMAAYAEGSYLTVAHDEAEPTLLDDTKGYGGGVIATYLKHRFAASFTGGFIIPLEYKGGVSDQLTGLPEVPAHVYYGKAVNYSLSFGYLLSPKTYTDYNQTNWNIYVEFIGKSYGAAKVDFSNILAPGSYYPVSVQGVPVLLAGQYVELHPGVQCIIKSNLRIDLSAGFPFIDKSYAHYYPLYTVGIQRYLYFNKG
jgi:hypothetical protein